MQNLMAEPPPTKLTPDEAAQSALDAALAAGPDPAALAGAAGAHPTHSAAWGALAKHARINDQPVAAYAYARTGYHRGLDQLRANGWRGHGPVPWSHQPNQGFLRCLYELARAADAIGEQDEADRCAKFLRDCDPDAPAKLAAS